MERLDSMMKMELVKICESRSRYVDEVKLTCARVMVIRSTNELM